MAPHTPTAEERGDSMQAPAEAPSHGHSETGFPSSGAPEPGQAPRPQPDWLGVLNLIAEARDAVRVAQERTAAAEHYSEKLDQHYREKIKRLEARLLGAEKRIESADGRAAEAEEWLIKLRDAIENGFAGVLRTE